MLCHLCGMRITIYSIHFLCFVHVSMTIPSMSRKLLGKIAQDPSISKSKMLHLDVVWYFFINSRYFVHSSRTIGGVPKVLNLNRLFVKLNWFIYK